MIRFKLAEVLADREMTPYALAQQAGIPVPRAYRLATSDPAKQITRLPMETLDLLCRTLGVQPGDLLEYVPDRPRPPRKR